MRHLDGRASRPRRSSTGDHRTERPARDSGIYRSSHGRGEPAHWGNARHDESRNCESRNYESEHDQSEFRHDQSQWNQWEHE